MELREKELFPPLKEYLNKRGYKVYTEIPIFGTAIDVIAVLNDTNVIVALELKTGFNIRVFYQAQLSISVVNRSYVVAPTKPRIDFIEKCRQFGVGIIRVNDCKCEKILEAEFNNINENYKDRFDFTGMQEGQTAGLPTMKGVGPAQDCLRRIKLYLKRHPSANWIEIYKNVGSHYAHFRSMQGSMRQWCGFSLRK